ncbi:MAG: MFS transporter [Alphaproteobacteria bacterium]|nr:MFS transporter [Alphaproteobacteria bacterium]MCB9929619.1 MFS transporter [Alphaproteobacteria bacterium]
MVETPELARSRYRDRRNVAVLATCQMLYNSGRSLLVATSPLIAYQIAPDKALSTVPIFLAVVGTAAASIPASLLMRRIGRGPGFSVGSLIGIAGGLACIWGIETAGFLVFCLGALLFGFFSGFAQLYRFAAADVASDAFKSRAISLVLTGGLVAAFVGPELAKLGEHLVADRPFLASYAFLVGLTVLSGIIVLAVDIPKLTPEEAKDSGRPIGRIMRQPVFIVATLCATVGQAVMNLLMTSTPLAMNHAQHQFASTALVIEWHIFFMYAPGFFTGTVIRWLGVTRVIAIGIALQTICVGIALSGTEVLNFWGAMALLGLGWNFAFTASTNLLTEAHTAAERAKTQAATNFIIFSVVALGAISSGALMHAFGWTWVNLGALPLLLLSLLAALWLRQWRRSQARLAETPAA